MSRKTFFAILLAATIVFVLANTLTGGYMFDMELMGAQIMTEPHLLDEYNITDLAPFKYRILFAWIVQGTYELLGGNSNTLFFGTFIAWSYFFFITACLSFYWLMHTLRFSRKLSLIGISLFLICPAVAMGYTPPVHTREDFLAYTLLCLGLVFLIKNRTLPFMLTCVVAIMCRETLLILPFVMLFFTRSHSVFKRMLMAIIPFAAWVGFRILLGYERYDMTEGLMYNIENYLQIPAFFFITFHAMWVLFLFSMVSRKSLTPSTEGRRIILSSGPWAVGLIFFTTFVGGIFNEIRLLQLAFPWIVVTNLVYLERYKSYIGNQITQPLYKGVVAILALLTGSLGYFILDRYGHMLSYTRYAVPVELWLIAGLFTFFLFTAWVPLALSIISEERKKSKGAKVLNNKPSANNTDKAADFFTGQSAKKEYIH
ncbi:hypothetical protein AB9P05_15365 [Roseivirga sp. BDSF3-8]|uniref:hypothetical protein n=1 Tax=Roseivirga sp. BDSF3-8 TaxID=3241598 RepID=UPI00353217A2